MRERLAAGGDGGGRRDWAPKSSFPSAFFSGRKMIYIALITNTIYGAPNQEEGQKTVREIFEPRRGLACCEKPWWGERAISCTYYFLLEYERVAGATRSYALRHAGGHCSARDPHDRHRCSRHARKKQQHSRNNSSTPDLFS